MEQHGFIHSMLDVKVLILYVMRRVQYPADIHKVYELSFQDDCLSYFDVAQALPQMVDSGHLTCSEEGIYAITPKGIETCELTEDSLAFPVKERVKAAVERFNQACRRDDYVTIRTTQSDKGELRVMMQLNDEVGTLMTLELSAPSQKQARVLEKAFRERAETLYQIVITELLDEETEEPDA